MIHIKNLYWKIFFSAYWLAYDLGEKKTPEWNAAVFLKFTSTFNMFGLIFLVNFVYGGDFPYMKLLIVLAMVFSFSIHKSIVYSKKSGFKKHIETYNYLSKPEMKKKRNQTVISVILFTLLFMLMSMATINPTVKLFLNKLW